MRIGGFVPFTLLDFPGRVAAIVFLQGCNYRCPYCHNRALIPMRPPEKRLAPEKVIRKHIEEYSDRLDGVVVTGGEPTLQQDLPDFLGWIRSLGLETKLDTNGSRPRVLAKLLSAELLSYVAMDIKAPLDKYPALTGRRNAADNVQQSIRLIAHSGVEHEFRTTVDETLLLPDDLLEIKRLVPLGSPYRIQQARNP